MCHRHGVSQLPGELDPLLTPPQRPIRIPQHPQTPGGMASTADVRVVTAVNEGVGAVLIAVIQGDSLLEMVLGGSQVAYEHVRRPHRVMSLKQERRVLGRTGQAEKLLAEVFPCLDLRSCNDREP